MIGITNGFNVSKVYFPIFNFIIFFAINNLPKCKATAQITFSNRA